MNRAQRRQAKRESKTSVQTTPVLPVVSEIAIEAEVIKRCDRVWEKMSEVLIQIMRKNRISQERITKIIAEFKCEMNNQFIRAK